MAGMRWENRKVTDATSHYFLKMETAALASQPFCRTVAVLQKPHHQLKVEHRAEFPFPPLFIHDVRSFLWPKPTQMTHMRAVTQSRTHCATASWGRKALIRVVGALRRWWWVRVTPQGGTNMATEVVLWLHHVSTGGSPRKKHIFSMCNFYYYFHSSCTYSSTVEMLKQNKTFTYFGNSAWWENLSWYFADNKATLSILTFLDTHPGNICSLSKKKNHSLNPWPWNECDVWKQGIKCLFPFAAIWG